MPEKRIRPCDVTAEMVSPSVNPQGWRGLDRLRHLEGAGPVPRRIPTLAEAAAASS